jgi:hypothetical protein
MVGDIYSISKSMKAKTFKQQVEEIQKSKHIYCVTNLSCTFTECPSCKKEVDRILAAHDRELDRIAERLKQQSIESAIDVPCWNGAQQAQLKSDQAYIQAQKEGM